MSTAEAPPAPLSARRDGGLLSVGFGNDDAFNWGLFALCLAIALGLHAALGAGATRAPQKKAVERVEMAIYRPPPPPPPPPEPEPEKPKPEKKPPPKAEPPPPPPSNDTPPEPPPEPVPLVTGINQNSVVNSGGPAVRTGNTTFGDPNAEKYVDPSQVKAYQGGEPGFKAARSSSLSREASGVKDFKAPYPKELASQGIEGSVVLLVEVTKTGAVRSVRLAKGCGNKTLDQLAVDALKRFRFAPAEADGAAVDSLLRYTYRFELYD